MTRHRLLRVINATAPARVCDNGGWTDTWFAVRGKVFNVAVRPHAEVRIEVSRRGRQGPRVLVNAENFGEVYAAGEGRQPLLDAAIERVGVPEESDITVTVFSEMPAGASTGTSAAVTVALVGALDRLRGGRMTRREVARLAHAVETEALGRQSGVQDQLCAAFGGVNFIEIERYPEARVTPVRPPREVLRELERRLSLVYLGKAHSSSEVHEKVIRELEDAGPDCARLEDLRRTAELSRGALLAGDFDALGRAMAQNTEAQARLHPELVGRDAARVIDIARRRGAAGWKVNGAGGEGGSVTILAGPSPRRTRAALSEIESADPAYRLIPITLSPRGLRTWETML